MGRLYAATRNTLRGLACAFRSESSVRQETTLLIVAAPVGMIIAPSAGWYVAMVGVLFATLAVELLNTSIEKFADHVTPEQHPEIGMIKDVGSAAVFCTLCLASLVWVAGTAVRLGLL
jgi:diacylglycerol kinase (ATP)